MGMFTEAAIAQVERNRLPDTAVRAGIRRLLKQRLESLPLSDQESLALYLEWFRQSMAESPLAIHTDEANEQHYELPADYFNLVLGPRRKYSSCYWSEGVRELAGAEDAALARTCRHAQLADGQRILELGCGWGSLSLWMAEQYPAARITAVSNSRSQKAWIDEQARAAGLCNLEVITADMNDFDTAGGFDRVVSVEMFEHMRNWSQVLGRIAGWLRGGGLCFMHLFCHRLAPYFFEVNGDNDWMSRHFFRGGMMPAWHLPLYFQDHLRLRHQWCWNGHHYADTLAAWRKRHERRKGEIMALFGDVYGDQAGRWYQRWRLFYLACEELFRFNGGEEWFVGHYLFQKPGA